MSLLAGALLGVASALQPLQDVVTDDRVSSARVESLDFTCVATKADSQLARDMADHFLSGRRDSTPNLQSRLDVAMQHCVDEQGIEEHEFDPFFIASLGTLMTMEFESRLAEVGFDMRPIEEMVAVYLEEPTFNISVYVDRRPDQFQQPIEAIVADGRAADGQIEELIGIYFQFWRDTEDAKTKLETL